MYVVAQVTTADGYILNMQRIPSGRNGGGGAGKPPVIIQHGVLVVIKFIDFSIYFSHSISVFSDSSTAFCWVSNYGLHSLKVVFSLLHYVNGTILCLLFWPLILEPNKLLSIILGQK